MKEQSRECKSKRIQEMHRRVCQIKASEKAEVKYMQTWEEKILIKQEGIAEGRLEGKLEEKQELTRKLANKSQSNKLQKCWKLIFQRSKIYSKNLKMGSD